MYDAGAAIERSSDLGQIWQTVGNVSIGRGYHEPFYLHLPPAGLAGSEPAFHFGGCDFAAEYVAEKRFLVDPFAMHGLHSTEPFVLREIERHRALSDIEHRFKAFAESHDCADGIGLPVFGPAGRTGYFELRLEAGHPPPSDTELREMHLIAQLAHLKICGLQAADQDRPKLTPREQQILEWLAQGKSNDVIGCILGLSAHTIDTYLRRIYEKLDVGDRVSASMRATGLGLITGIAPPAAFTPARARPRARGAAPAP
jgi:DNA-binding CsgD family transcriptional regulator